MAYVPDDAMRRRRRDRLTPAAWEVYEAHCSYRNHESGYSWASKQRLSRDFGIPIGTVRNAMTELRQKAWVNETERGVALLVGDFSPVDRRRRATAEPLPGSGKTGETQWHLVPDPGNSIPQIASGIPESGKEIPQSGNSPNKERARVLTSSITSTLTSHSTNTHTPAARADAGERLAADAGVCVPMPKSRFSREQCVAWAEHQRAGGGRIDPYAVGRSRWMDGTADEEVAEFLAKREQIRDGCPVQERRLTPYHVALQMARSVAQAAGADVARYIDSLEDVDDETRAKLREALLDAPAAGASGRAPP